MIITIKKHAYHPNKFQYCQFYMGLVKCKIFVSEELDTYQRVLKSYEENHRERGHWKEIDLLKFLFGNKSN